MRDTLVDREVFVSLSSDSCRATENEQLLQRWLRAGWLVQSTCGFWPLAFIKY